MAQRAGRIAAAGGERAVSFEAAPEDLNESALGVACESRPG